jgi:hypothetical protein
MNGGPPEYLCPRDCETLADIIIIAAESLSPLGIEDIIDEAYNLALDRQVLSFKFLTACHSEDMADHRQAEIIRMPSRTWVANFCEANGIDLKNRREIAADRISGGYREHIAGYFIKFGPLIQSYPPELVFGADESMLDTIPRSKVAVPKGTREAIEIDESEFPHITAMLCHSPSGASMPPFFLIPKLLALPAELESLSIGGRCYIASSPKGWMTRDAFLLWTIHFINFLSSYRLNLPKSMREKETLLIVDGHTSRGTPIALALRRFAKIKVLVLPSHTSHILQMFDICLANPFKAHFTKIFTALRRHLEEEFPSAIAKKRYIALRAAIAAWTIASQPENCISSGRESGHYPFSPDSVLSGRWVFDLNPEQKVRALRSEQRCRNRPFNINDQVITEPDAIVGLIQLLKTKPETVHLCEVRLPKYSVFVKKIVAESKNNVHLLTRVPPYIPFHSDKEIITFD